jgi:hypothetical protein
MEEMADSEIHASLLHKFIDYLIKCLKYWPKLVVIKLCIAVIDTLLFKRYNTMDNCLI